MESPELPHSSVAFVLRIQRGPWGVRGEVVAVSTGRARRFQRLQDAMTFIEAVLQERAGEPGGGSARKERG